MSHRMTGPVGRVLVVTLAVIVGYWLLLFLLQRRLVFPAPPLLALPPRPHDAQLLWLDHAGGRTEAWYLAPLVSAAGPAPVLLFAHGNAELIDHWAGDFVELRRRGMAVLLVEYPGYGRSGGSPSRASIQHTFEAAYDWAAANPALDGSRIVVFGRSLGGGAAAALSETRKVAALMLESTFTRSAALAWQFGAPPLLVRDRFDNLDAVGRYAGPLLLLHGDRDEIIPVEHGHRLAAAGQVELHLLRCGHNDCEQPWDLMAGFLVQHRVLGSPAGGPPSRPAD